MSKDTCTADLRQWRVRTLGLLPEGRRQFTDALVAMLPMLLMVPLWHNFQMPSDVFRFFFRFMSDFRELPLYHALTRAKAATVQQMQVLLYVCTKLPTLMVAKMLRASELHCRLICPFAM